jgi:hypothetical protein
MLCGRERVTLFLGNFGSGKTEVAVNYALHFADRDRDGSASGNGTTLVDLDLVNPYFRSREPMEELEAHGVRVVVPDAQYRHADLPILAPEVRAALMASTSRVILDVGGDDVGARVLGALHDALPSGSYRALMVLNGNRPHTRDVAGIIRIRSEIELAGRIQVTGFVSNTHLMGETTVATVLAGYRLAKQASSVSGLPLEFITAPPGMAEEVAGQVDCEVLPLRRTLSVPWQKRDENRNVGKALFRL